MLLIPYHQNLFASTDIIRHHTYALSLDGDNYCQLPIVDTVKGAFTAAHCIKELRRKGYKRFWGINEFGVKKRFRLILSNYQYRGLDYAFLTDNDRFGIRIGNSKDLVVGQKIYMYSPKLGLTEGKIEVIPDPKYDDIKVYIDIGERGESGSGVYNVNAELIGIFVARTGFDENSSGVLIPIHKILEDVSGF